MHWDWDWYHCHHWHRPWDPFLYHNKCSTVVTRAATTRFRSALTNFPWDCHHYDCSYSLPEWCHHSCLTDRVYVETGEEEDTCGKGTFKVVIDVHHFKGDELKLKVKNSDFLMLEGQHKDERANKSPGLCITKAFTRQYKLPRNYDATQAKATLSKDGILSIIVPAPPPLDDAVRDIEIIQTETYFGSKDQAIEDTKEGKLETK
ncbi:heat shock protein 22 [Stomoxys calcitrans]|uniref:heat shock protein 22 n=1 Tax=Stomoxys calcitrans TaxID=35570 RepID=UPI0027E2F1CA|nr:heat shock protein 22 [Stomoxys calcitrans]